MALIINHNLMAGNASRNLGNVYSKLSTSVQRLSSGLRINSAADDAAGLAIREMMRSDIAVTQQGIRNAADAVSMIQTADGALAVIDEKLTRMKELAEQASTGTYTTVQREIINSEYQAMAAEIDRIANATNFNGIKLLDGSVNQQHGGQGLKVHFGTGNNAAEDYYFVNIGDARATSNTGLRVGGDAKNDIWAQGGAAKAYGSNEGCCAGGFEGLNTTGVFENNQAFAYGYNWDWKATDDSQLKGGKYTAGMYEVNAGDTLQDLINKVNAGTQSRVAITFSSAGGTPTSAAILRTGGTLMSAYGVCLGDEVYFVGNSAAAHRTFSGATIIQDIRNGAGNVGSSLTSAINSNNDSQFWALWETDTNTCYVFRKDGGNNNDLMACEKGVTIASASGANNSMSAIQFTNVASGVRSQSGANFSLGGEHWGTMKAIQTGTGGNETWNVAIEGRDVGNLRDLLIQSIGGANGDLSSAATAVYRIRGKNFTTANKMGPDTFTEIQNAANSLWKGADIRTQSAAQEALDALSEAIIKKDKIRADLGAIQNRLENTMTNLEIQAENLQAAESRISDVDMAKEMTEFTKNSVLTQAATGMLAQANSLNQLALTLLG